MSMTLISFLGRGPYSDAGVRREYFETQYQFPRWCSNKVPFFLEALLHWLRECHKQKPSRLVILGTTGSMWDALLTRFCVNFDEIQALWLDVCQRVDQHQVTRDDLKSIEKILSVGLEVEVYAELIQPGESPADQAQILSALQKHVQQRDRVYIDVTHGYRHQPMLGLGAASLLTKDCGAMITDILYGAAEMRSSRQAPAPVVSLRWLLDLLAASDSVERFRAGGGLSGLAAVIPAYEKELAEAIDRTAFYIDTNQVAQASQSATRALALLQNAVPDPVLDLVRPRIKRSLDRIAACERDPHGIIALAREALAQEDYLRAAALMSEAADASSGEPGIELDQGQVNAIKALRNAVIHADEPNWRRIGDALDSPKSMRKFLRKHLDWLGKCIPQRNAP